MPVTLRHLLPAACLCVCPVSFAAENITLPLAGETPVSARQDRGELAGDRSVDGKPLSIGGRVFASGLGMHANGEAIYDLDPATLAFEAQVGVDDAMKGQPRGATVVFRVFVDGEKKFDSGLMRAGDTAKPVKLDLRGAHTLELTALDGGDGIAADHADWGDARLVLARTPEGPAEYTVAGDGLTLGLSKEGALTGFTLAGKAFPVSGRLTSLAGCRAEGEPRAQKIGDGVAFIRTLADRDKHRATVTDTFTHAKHGVRWTVEIKSDDAPWSTAISTSVRCKDTAGTRIWTGWVSPDAATVSAATWHDPLVPMAFTDRTFTYGMTASPNRTVGCATLPLVSLLSTAADTGLSLVFSPDDITLDANLTERTGGAVRWTRVRHRLGGGKTIVFHTDLVAHESDWRGGLRALVERYPDFFEAPNPKAHQIAGCGAYSTGEEKYDAAKLRKMAFGFNWKLSDDFPYMGMFLPPVKSMDEKWERSCAEPSSAYVGPTTSCRRMNDYARRMKENGFAVLSYFNATEFGKNMHGRKPVRKADDPELWKDPAGFVAHTFPAAVTDPGIRTCYDALVMDPGEPKYRDFLIGQAARNTAMLPDTDGICIDRTDWLRLYDRHADDGVSWVDGKPARSLHRSWEQFMEKLGRRMHAADRLIFVNILSARLDTLHHADGVYTEYGMFGNGDEINIAALTCPRKPAVLWTVNGTLDQPDPDAFMQRHLHLGVFPTAPYPHNNHCINPDPKADALYLAYGPLLDAMRGRKWVLAPHCVESTTPGVKVNLFETSGGYALPVTFGGAAKEAVILVRNIGDLRELKAEAILPGTGKPVALTGKPSGDALELTVPLVRGAAMVRLGKQTASSASTI